MSRYFYYQQQGGEEEWKPCPAEYRKTLEAEKSPAFFTVLAVSQTVEGLSYEDKQKLRYAGDLYFDFDAKDIDFAIEQATKFLLVLEGKGVDMAAIRLYATGGRGFHCEVPMGTFLSKVPKDGVQFLPLVFKELAFELAVDALDLRVYSAGRGRMWRTPNVKRENGRYKVPITWEELKVMDAQTYQLITAAPRPLFDLPPPKLCVDLMVLFDTALTKVKDKASKRKKKNNDQQILKKLELPSLTALLEGRGVKSGVGFHQLALQLAIVADSSGWTEEQLVEKAAGLIEKHESDNNRYNTTQRRRDELVRMHRYCSDNPCYEFSIGALKVLLNHEAPDLDGIPVKASDIDSAIAEANAAPKETAEVALDEYSDVASAVSLSKFGVYAATEEGKKRISAVSFDNVHILLSAQTGQVSCYEADVLVNGENKGRQVLELDVFAGVQSFNKFAGRMSHALNGSDSHVRSLMMRIAEKGRKEGKTFFVLNREGLDMINIVNHADEDLREPFMVWADNSGVLLDPRVQGKGFEFSFQGFPDPRGSFRTDLSDGPKLVDWVEDLGNKELLRNTLQNMLTCQRPDVLGKIIGWYTACFYRMLFHKAYSKFPLMHVNGAAGSGKSLRRGTKVLMADGSQKAVEDVREGEQLLGPNGRPRNVLALGRGQETMYEVRPVKGAPYYVNESHILSLRRSYRGSCRLSDGTYVPADQEILNVNVKVWSESTAATQKLFKGYRSGPVEFHRAQEPLLIPPYILGVWLGDGQSAGPTIHKPACRMVDEWKAYGASLGLETYEYRQTPKNCSAWRLAPSLTGRMPGDQNPAREALKILGLVNDKHIPEAYKFASVADRLELIAGLLDSDGHMIRGGYDWISKCPKMAEDFAFICRSVGLAAYVKPSVKGIRSTGFSATYYRVSVSGDCDRIPCRDKVAPPRQQIKSHLVTGLSFKKLAVEDYYGVVLDGDHLFLLDDFTVTHNTEFNLSMLRLFFYNQEPKALTPGSTLFAIQQHLAGSASVPLLLDEYKPAEMPYELHNKLKLMFRDAYNCRDVTRGGGTRDNDDYRSLYSTQLAAPLVFVAEAAEEEAAVMERVVLVTMVKPPASMALTWSTRFHIFQRNHQCLSILGQYLANDTVLHYSVEQLTQDFDPLFSEAQDKYMLSQQDLKNGLSEEDMKAKQGAKERTVFNYTVARFGLRRFRALVKDIFDNDFEQIFEGLESSIYDRMTDLLPSTQPEWVKVLSQIAVMSVNVEKDNSSMAIRVGSEYAFTKKNGKDALELSARSSYHRYRAYAKVIGQKPLFPGDGAFLHGLKDSPAVLAVDIGDKLKVPGGVFYLDLEELARMGVEPFADH